MHFNPRTLCLGSKDGYFNPHSPRGGRRKLALISFCVALFQSTLPAESVSSEILGHVCPSSYAGYRIFSKITFNRILYTRLQNDAQEGYVTTEGGLWRSNSKAMGKRWRSGGLRGLRLAQRHRGAEAAGQARLAQRNTFRVFSVFCCSFFFSMSDCG